MCGQLARTCLSLICSSSVRLSSVSEHPRGDPPHFRHLRCRRWRCPCPAKRTKVNPGRSCNCRDTQMLEFRHLPDAEEGNASHNSSQPSRKVGRSHSSDAVDCSASFILSTPRACAESSARAERIVAPRPREPDCDTPESSSELDTAAPRRRCTSSDSSRSARIRSKDSDFEVFRIRTLSENGRHDPQSTSSTTDDQPFLGSPIPPSLTGKYLQPLG